MKLQIGGIALVLGMMPFAAYTRQKTGGAIGAANANACLQSGNANKACYWAGDMTTRNAT